MEPKHSGFGIASFVISLGTGFFLFVILIILGVMESQSPGGIDEEAPITVVLGLLLIGGFLAELVSAGLGVGGLLQRDRKKVFAVLGLVMSVVTAVGLTALLLIGLATDA
jgi:hypothetical protein